MLNLHSAPLLCRRSSKLPRRSSRQCRKRFSPCVSARTTSGPGGRRPDGCEPVWTAQSASAARWQRKWKRRRREPIVPGKPPTAIGADVFHVPSYLKICSRQGRSYGIDGWWQGSFQYVGILLADNRPLICSPNICRSSIRLQCASQLFWQPASAAFGGQGRRSPAPARQGNGLEFCNKHGHVQSLSFFFPSRLIRCGEKRGAGTIRLRMSGCAFYEHYAPFTAAAGCETS